MTDANIAHSLIEEAFPVRGGRNVKAALGAVLGALKQRERSLPASVLAERERAWTERRVRSLWEKKARRIDHYEIQDLTAVAVEEARLERQRQKARDARLEALIASQGPGEDQHGDRPFGWMARRLDNAGSGRAETDADFDQRDGWGR